MTAFNSPLNTWNQRFATDQYIFGEAPNAYLRSQMAQGNLYMAHRFGFTKRTLTETLGAAGFQTIACLQRPASFDLWAVASKNILTGPEITALAQKHFPNGV